MVKFRKKESYHFGNSHKTVDGVVAMEHPGLELEKRINACGMSRKELALRTGVTEKHISTVINGDRGISANFARKLGYVFPKAEDWLKLQNAYDQEQLCIKDEENITEDEIKILEPLREITEYFIEQGYMHNHCGDITRIMKLRELLNISDLTSIPKITYNAAYRAQLSKNVRVNPYVLFAWQRLCEKKTERIAIQEDLDKEKLKANLPDIKAMMFDKINNSIQVLQEYLARCGIAFQVVKNFRGAPVQGFIKQDENHRLILCLTIRRKRADTFWFTLFHEIAHILYGDYSVRFVDFDSVPGEQEERANQFARDTLIAPKPYRKFVHSGNYENWAAIEKFAEEMKVEPFIVLGRLQSDQLLDWRMYSKKIKKYEWA